MPTLTIESPSITSSANSAANIFYPINKIIIEEKKNKVTVFMIDKITFDNLHNRLKRIYALVARDSDFDEIAFKTTFSTEAKSFSFRRNRSEALRFLHDYALISDETYEEALKIVRQIEGFQASNLKHELSDILEDDAEKNMDSPDEYKEHITSEEKESTPNGNPTNFGLSSLDNRLMLFCYNGQNSLESKNECIVCYEPALVQFQTNVMNVDETKKSDLEQNSKKAKKCLVERILIEDSSKTLIVYFLDISSFSYLSNKLIQYYSVAGLDGRKKSPFKTAAKAEDLSITFKKNISESLRFLSVYKVISPTLYEQAVRELNERSQKKTTNKTSLLM
jgi:hypothetical protein